MLDVFFPFSSSSFSLLQFLYFFHFLWKSKQNIVFRKRILFFFLFFLHSIIIFGSSVWFKMKTTSSFMKDETISSRFHSFLWWIAFNFIHLMCLHNWLQNQIDKLQIDVCASVCVNSLSQSATQCYCIPPVMCVRLFGFNLVLVYPRVPNCKFSRMWNANSEMRNLLNIENVFELSMFK